jgi:DNA-binding NarL/FixJ family response regulator
MQTISEGGRPARVWVGGPLRVLLVVDQPSLLLRLSEVVRSFSGLQVVGAFTAPQDVVDWTVWDRGGWHLAFIDLALKRDGTREVVGRLLEDRRPGRLVALGDHLWRETRAECAALGIQDLLEKGDMLAFRSFLEQQVR